MYTRVCRLQREQFKNALIFDLDNTLFDRDALARKALVDMGFKGDLLEEMVTLDQGGNSDRLALSARAIELLPGVWGGPEDFWDAFRFRVSDTEYDARLFGLLERLTKSFRLGVLTNGGSENQRRKLQGLGLEDLFDEIVISQEVGISKPNPAIFELIVERLGTDFSSSVLFGDSLENDCIPALELGMDVFWVHNAVRDVAYRKELAANAVRNVSCRNSASKLGELRLIESLHDELERLLR